MDCEVKGKVVVVTGGANGIGLAIVSSFLENGVKLAILLDVDENQGNDSATTLKHKFGNDRVVFYKCDVQTDLEVVYEKVIRNHKNVDIHVNNAGILNESSIEKTIGTNVISVIGWTMKFHEHMRTDKGGKGGTIINVSSIYGHRITPFVPVYHASKHAVLGFSKSLGDEYNFERTGVRVVAVCPGLTVTNASKGPSAWEDSITEDFWELLKTYSWQTADCVGNATVEIFQKAESGSVWLVENSKPAEKWDV